MVRNPNPYHVYLAGPIMGKTWVETESWRDEFKELVNNLHIRCLSPMRTQTSTSNEEPNGWVQDADAPRAQIEQDRFDVARCDIVVANITHMEEKSVGTIIEIGWADAYRKPIVLIDATKQYRHPFLYHLASWRVTTIRDAAEIVSAVL